MYKSCSMVRTCRLHVVPSELLAMFFKSKGVTYAQELQNATVGWPSDASIDESDGSA